MQYHMKAHHDLDIELSQGLEERYLRLKANQEQKKLLRIQQVQDPLSHGNTKPSDDYLTDNEREPMELDEGRSM